MEAGFQAHSKRIKKLKPKWSQSFVLPLSSNGVFDLKVTFDDAYCFRTWGGLKSKYSDKSTLSAGANSLFRKVVGCMEECYNGPLVDNPWSQDEYGNDQPSTDEPKIGTEAIGSLGSGNKCPKIIGLDTTSEFQASNFNFATDGTSLQTIQSPELDSLTAINAFHDPGNTYTVSGDIMDPNSIKRIDQDPDPIITASDLALPSYDGINSGSSIFLAGGWGLSTKVRRSARDFRPHDDVI